MRNVCTKSFYQGLKNEKLVTDANDEERAAEVLKKCLKYFCLHNQILIVKNSVVHGCALSTDKVE